MNVGSTAQRRAIRRPATALVALALALVAATAWLAITKTAGRDPLGPTGELSDEQVAAALWDTLRVRGSRRKASRRRCSSRRPTSSA